MRRGSAQKSGSKAQPLASGWQRQNNCGLWLARSRHGVGARLNKEHHGVTSKRVRRAAALWTAGSRKRARHRGSSRTHSLAYTLGLALHIACITGAYHDSWRSVTLRRTASNCSLYGRFTHSALKPHGPVARRHGSKAAASGYPRAAGRREVERKAAAPKSKV